MIFLVICDFGVKQTAVCCLSMGVFWFKFNNFRVFWHTYINLYLIVIGELKTNEQA